MAATFNSGLLTATDRVRLLLGDVPEGGVTGTVTSPLLQDDTIAAMLVKYPYNEACRQLAISLMSQYAAEPDKYEEGNGKRLEWRNRLDGWKAILKELKSTPTPTAARPGIAIGLITEPLMTNMRTD